MTTITLRELGDGSVAIEPTGPAGATDDAKRLAEDIRASMNTFGPDLWTIVLLERYGATLHAGLMDGRRFVIIVAELPS